MSNLIKRTLYSDGKLLIRKVDRWVSRRYPQSAVGQESDWLGWDGWVRAEKGRLTVDAATPDKGVRKF